MFFMAFQSSQIWGNLISSLVLDVDSKNRTLDISFCGSEFCNADNGESIQRPTNAQRFTLSSIYLACSFAAAILVTLAVDPLTRFFYKAAVVFAVVPWTKDFSIIMALYSLVSRYGEKDRDGESSKLTGISLFFATFRQMRNPVQLLLIPITIWSGMEQGFFSADFTQVGQGQMAAIES